MSTKARRPLAVAAGLLMTGALTVPAVAGTFAESPDAGDVPAAAAEAPAGTTAISGSLTNANDADLYELCLDGGKTFSASTADGGGNYQNFVAGLPFPHDSQMFLFDSQGKAVYGNDDAPGGTFRSKLPAGNALTPSAGGTYYLALSDFNNDPRGADSGPMFQDDTGTAADLWLPVGNSTLADWNDDGAVNGGGGNYTIALTGICDPPTVSAIDGDADVSEGDSGTYSVTASDPDPGDSVTYAWSVTSGNAVIDGASDGSSVDLDFGDGPSAVELQVVVTDEQGNSVTKTRAIDVANVAPTLSELTATGNSGTACLGGDDVDLDFTFSDPAGVEDTYDGTIDWGDGASDVFSSSPVSGSHTYAAGTYTIKVDVSDEDGGDATQKTASVSLLYGAGEFRPPINADGSSVFKVGSTVPVKIVITDCNGSQVTTLHPDVDLVKTDTTPEGAVNEVISSSAADTGDDMRYDGTSQYIYNLSTKRSQFCAQANSACSDGDLTAGSYRLTVSDPTIGSVSETFNLRSK